MLKRDMKYQPMRGSFKDAAKEAVEFDGSLRGLVEAIESFYKDDPVLSGWASEANVAVAIHPFDQSGNGNVYTVTVDQKGVGFTNAPLIK